MAEVKKEFIVKERKANFHHTCYYFIFYITSCHILQGEREEGGGVILIH